MTTYVVCYSIGKEEKKYKSFIAALTVAGGVKVLPCCYLVNTNRHIEEMRVALIPYIEKGDSLFIGAVSGEVAVRNALCGNDMLQKILVDSKKQEKANEK